MATFDYYLEKSGEVGYADQVFGNIVYASGLPTITNGEVVVFENGDIGQVLSVDEYVEILLLSSHQVPPGIKVTRTGEQFKIPVGDFLLGMKISPISMGPLVETVKTLHQGESRLVDAEPLSLSNREAVSEPFDTGVSAVDLVIPLGHGQRELVLGDRKTGKTRFLFQTVINQTKKGCICIYAAIGKKRGDLKDLREVMEKNNALKKMVMVYSLASDPPGLSFLTPYVAMTIAEYFRDKNHKVLVVMDDLTTHAKYWREISLLARRFPGRNSYPGDIFYIHSKLLERAGSFKKGSITCFPVAETVLGDISGYIQTNLMSMTDGHIYFDTDLFDHGRRPAINPLLSVTRVGLQTHTGLLRDLARVLTSFLVYVERMSKYVHFGSELGEEARANLELGERVIGFLEQPQDLVIPININALMLAALWAGFWRGIDKDEMRKQVRSLVEIYETNSMFKSRVDEVINAHKTFKDLVETLKRDSSVFDLAKNAMTPMTPTAEAAAKEAATLAPKQ